jgi:hypothetical protein
MFFNTYSCQNISPAELTEKIKSGEDFLLLVHRRDAGEARLRIGGNSLSSLRSIKILVNFGLNEGYDVSLLQEVTAFSEAFNPDTAVD